MLGFNLFSPLPRLTLANKVAHHHHHHLIHTTSLPPLISLDCCWIQHTQNQAGMLSFEIFSPQPSPLTCGLEQAPEPAPPPPFTTFYTTPPSPPHHLFPLAHPKPSHCRMVSGFWPKTPKPLPITVFIDMLLVFQTCILYLKKFQ